MSTKYDFSDFDTPKKEFDFSDFDDPSLLDQTLDGPASVAGSQVGRNIPIVGPLAVKAGHAFRAGIGALTGTDAGAAIPGGGEGRSFGELYDHLQSEDAAKQKDLEDRHPVATAVGGTAGSLAAPIPGAGMKGAAGVTTRIGGTAGIMGADTAVRGGDVEDVSKAAAIGGGISAGIEALPLVGKIARAVKRMFPGVEDSVTNKITAKAASMFPGQQATAEEIEAVLSKPALRREAAATNLSKEASELAPELGAAQAELKKAAGREFGELEGRSLAASTPADELAAKDVLAKVAKDRDFIDANKQFYGPTSKKMYDDVVAILDTGGPKDAAGALGSVNKNRVLEARRHVDDAMRNRDFDKLSKYEKQAFTELRDSLDNPLKTQFTGSGERDAADKLWVGHTSASDNFFKPLTKKAPDKSKSIDPNKIARSLKSGGTKGAEFDESMGSVQKFIADNPSLGELPGVKAAFERAGKLRDVGGMTAQMEHLKRASGGPSSQSVNMSLQGGAAVLTGGASLAALPITNPVAYMRLLDNVAAQGGKMAKYAPALKRIYEQRGPAALAAAHAALLGQDPEYKAAFEGANSTEP